MINDESITSLSLYVSPFDFAATELQWSKITGQIAGFKYREVGWDGEGARVPSSVLINSLINYLGWVKQNNAMAAPDRTVLSTDGSIIVEWQTTNTVYELEMSEPGVGEWMQSQDDEEPVCFSVTWFGDEGSLGAGKNIGTRLDATTSTLVMREYMYA